MDRDIPLEALLATTFQAHPWHGIPARPSPDSVHAYIEVVPTDAIKYELDKASGQLRIDRPQRFSSLCPTLYGFVPQTYCGDRVGQRTSERGGGAAIQGDGDPLDICVLTERNVAHGLLATVRPIGGLRMIDRAHADDKIIAVLEADVAYGHFTDIGDCPQSMIDRLRHYFLSYKQEPGGPPADMRIAEVYDRKEANEVIARSIADYCDNFGQPERRIERLLHMLKSR